MQHKISGLIVNETHIRNIDGLTNRCLTFSSKSNAYSGQSHDNSQGKDPRAHM